MVKTSYYSNFCSALQSALSSLEVTTLDGSIIEPDDGLVQFCKLSELVAASGGCQYMCGNGASAAFANHMALDWTKAGGIKTYSFSDSAILTAAANDLGYDQMLSAPLGWYSKKGDLLVTISSSGDSENVLNAIAVARSMGLQVVTLSGMSSGNRSRLLGDLNFYIPGKTYGIVESSHQVLLHAWLDRFLDIPYE
ncbi:SIS domain-containing protein [Puniceicoccaceae bacterium K14]|nr:SIS domain-containing protein [Puniceicoccaceae bacterium K14]